MSTRLSATAALALMSFSAVAAFAPGTPQNVASAVTGNTVTLTWQAPSTGGVPTSYLVEALLSPGGDVVASIPTAATTVSVPNVPNGVYYVRVRAVDADGVSEPSGMVTITVPNGPNQCSSVPTPPIDLRGGATGNLVTLNWTDTFFACPPTSYAVYVGSAPGLSDLAVVHVPPSRTFSAVAPVGTYFVRVATFNSRGQSAPSNEIVVRVASDITPIGFNGVQAAQGAPFTNYSENGFAVTATAGNWYVANYGNPGPAIHFRIPPSEASAVGEMRVTAGGGTFTFSAVDVYSSVTTIPYQIVGLLAGREVLRMNGTVPLTYGQFATVVNQFNTTILDTLVIRLTNPATGCCPGNPVGLDNIVVRLR